MIITRLSKIGISIALIGISGSVVAQSVTTVVPSVSNQGQTLNVVISGQSTSFGQGTSTTQVWFNQGTSTVIYPNNITVNSNTQLTANYTFNNIHPTGYYDVNVYESVDGTLTNYNGFYLQANPNPPVIISVNPDNANLGQVLDVVISGQNTSFGQGTSTTQVWFNQGTSTIIYPNTVTVGNTNQLTANYTFNNTHPTGFYDVNVYESIDGTITDYNGFYLQVNSNPPFIASIDFNSANQGQTFNMIITGQNTTFNLNPNSPQAWFNMGTSTIFANSVMVSNATTLIANFSIPNNAPLGIWDLYVKDLSMVDTLTFDNSFEIFLLGTGIDDVINTELPLKITPNPFQDKIRIDYFLNQNSKVEITLFDGSGRKVRSNIKENVSSGNHQYIFDFSNNEIPAGVYFIKLKANDKESSYKIIKGE